MSKPDPETEILIQETVQSGIATGETSYRIVLQFNILRRSDSTGGFTNLDLIDEHMRDLNWGFRDTPFVFVRMPRINYINDDDYYNLDTIQEAFALYTEFFQPGVANIFLHDGILFNTTFARSYTSPTTPNRGHTYGDTRIGLPGNIAFPPDLTPQVVPLSKLVLRALLVHRRAERSEVRA